MTNETKQLLTNYQLEVEQYFGYWIDEFMATGKEPELETFELNRMWDLLKNYEMCNYAQYEGRYDQNFLKRFAKQIDNSYQYIQNVENKTIWKKKMEERNESKNIST